MAIVTVILYIIGSLLLMYSYESGSTNVVTGQSGTDLYFLHIYNLYMFLIVQSVTIDHILKTVCLICKS